LTSDGVALFAEWLGVCEDTGGCGAAKGVNGESTPFVSCWSVANEPAAAAASADFVDDL
jgi:hypothetical protein